MANGVSFMVRRKKGIGDIRCANNMNANTKRKKQYERKPHGGYFKVNAIYASLDLPPHLDPPQAMTIYCFPSTS